MINVCIAGATGWAGRALVSAVLQAEDLALRSAVSRSAAGADLGSALGPDALDVPVYATVAEALDGVDVLVDYTSHEAGKANTFTAIERGVAVVIGASGPTADDYAEIDTAAQKHAVGVISSGNFSITAAMAKAAAVLVARHLPQAEIIDFASDTKADVPSGTSRELAERLAAVRPAVVTRSIDQIDGPSEARGALVAGTPLHPVRLPSFAVSTEAPRRTPDDPARRRFVGHAIRLGNASRGPTRGRANRPHSRSRHPALRVLDVSLGQPETYSSIQLDQIAHSSASTGAPFQTSMTVAAVAGRSTFMPVTLARDEC